MKLLCSVATLFLVVGGCAMIAWPSAQNAYSGWSQRVLEAQMIQTEKTAPKRINTELSSVKHAKSSSHRALRHGVTTRHAAGAKWPATQLQINEIGVSAMVVQGVDKAALRRGPGHDTLSVWPGESGTCIIAGHRNVWGSWFYNLDLLRPGSVIVLKTPQHTFRYLVTRTQTVAENDTRLFSFPDSNIARLILYTCTLPHGDNRIVVVARRTS